MQNLLALFGRAAFGGTLAYRPRPQADSVKPLAHIHDDAHDFVVVVVFEGFADGGKLGV